MLDVERYPCIEKDCNNFVYFGPKDEEYYVMRGWVKPDGSINKPKRCKECRVKRNKRYAKKDTYKTNRQEG
jgi:hypothetical protein